MVSLCQVDVAHLLSFLPLETPPRTQIWTYEMQCSWCPIYMDGSCWRELMLFVTFALRYWYNSHRIDVLGQVIHIVLGPSWALFGADSVSVGVNMLQSSDSAETQLQDTESIVSAPLATKRGKGLFKVFPAFRSLAFPLILFTESNWLY